MSEFHINKTKIRVCFALVPAGHLCTIYGTKDDWMGGRTGLEPGIYRLDVDLPNPEPLKHLSYILRYKIIK